MNSQKYNLVVGYELPFAVKLFAGDANEYSMQIRVESLNAFTEEDLQRLRAHLEIFCHSGMLGMLAGNRTRPEIYGDHSEIDKFLILEETHQSDRYAEYTIKSIVIEPSSIVILLNKLFCLSEFFIEIKSMEITFLSLRIISTLKSIPITLSAISEA